MALGKDILKLGMVMLLLMITACAARREEPVSVAFAPTAPESPENLSPDEMAVLRGTGQIDANVPDKAMEDVARAYKYYLREGRAAMCAVSKRSEQYLSYARGVFRDKGMPEELANLAIVESGYRPAIVSGAGAAGAWQFMPATGLKYGLAQDEWQDERLDPYRATEAAADYLQKLYNDFGDWPTAIAAYNAGEGKLSRAKAQTGARDFFEVADLNHMLDDKSRLRDETKNYVPRFLAVSKIMRDLPRLGFDAVNPEKVDPMLRFKAAPGTDLKEMSRACDLDWDEFMANNRHHKRAITCTDRETFVYVPARAQKLASDYLCASGRSSYAGWRLVKVSGPDTLEKISKRSSIPLTRLQAANPGLGRLTAGQLILAPCQIPSPKNNPSVSVASSGNSGRTHSLQARETLFAISRKYNVPLQTLMAANNISDPSRLNPGMSLIIPGNEEKPAISATKPRYVVRHKDNLWKIAQLHKVTVDDLKRWNNVDEKSLKPGLALIVSR